MVFYRTFVLIVLVCIGSLGIAQEQTSNDHELWAGITLKYKLNKRLAFSLEQQVRMHENFSSVRSNFFEFGGRYRWNKYFYTRLYYRYTLRTDVRNIGRYTADFGMQQKIKKAKIKISYRARFQHATVEFTMQPATYLRNKVKLEYYRWKKILPFVSFENFYKFNNHQEFRGNRVIAGLEFPLGDSFDVKAFAGMDFELNTQLPRQRNLFGVLFIYTL